MSNWKKPSEGLLPCPFCGGRPGLGSAESNDRIMGRRTFWDVQCGTCGGAMRGRATKDLVITLWNARTTTVATEPWKDEDSP